VVRDGRGWQDGVGLAGSIYINLSVILFHVLMFRSFYTSMFSCFHLFTLLYYQCFSKCITHEQYAFPQEDVSSNRKGS
jgi:hypothetical protein